MPSRPQRRRPDAYSSVDQSTSDSDAPSKHRAGGRAHESSARTSNAHPSSQLKSLQPYEDQDFCSDPSKFGLPRKRPVRGDEKRRRGVDEEKALASSAREGDRLWTMRSGRKGSSRKRVDESSSSSSSSPSSDSASSSSESSSSDDRKHRRRAAPVVSRSRSHHRSHRPPTRTSDSHSGSDSASSRSSAGDDRRRLRRGRRVS